MVLHMLFQLNKDHLVSHFARVSATLRNSKGAVGRDLS